MTNELNHHGILGQKWGIRRFQNKDGSLTKASISLAKRHGFEEMPGTTNPDWTAYWKRYNR